MEAQVRRLQSTLRISGIALIFLGCWNIVKALIFFQTSRDEFKENLITLLGEDPGLSNKMLLVSVIVAMLIELGMYCYVGRSAILEASGRRHGWFYLAVAILELVSLVSNWITAWMHQDYSLFDQVIPGVTELIVLIAIFDILASSIRLKLLTRKLKEG